MKKNYTFFRCQEGSKIQIRKILSDATLIMSERTMDFNIIYICIYILYIIYYNIVVSKVLISKSLL